MNTQERPHISATARKHGIARKTLEDRWKGKSVSIQEANSLYRHCLTEPQEKALIGIVNDLTNRNMRPTSAIVKNLAEEINRGLLGKIWVPLFLQRHQDVLKSLYLSNIDMKRVKGEFPPIYQEFYRLFTYNFLSL